MRPKKPEVVKLKAIDGRDPQFKNPLLRVNIWPLNQLLIECPEWKPIDNLHRLGEYEGYYEVVER